MKEKPRKRRSNPWTVGLVALLVVGGGLYLLRPWRRPSPPAKPRPPRAAPATQEPAGQDSDTIGPAVPEEKPEDFPPAFGSRVLKRGMSGPDVELLQERLRLAGMTDYKFTPGVFDEATEQALIEYQKGTKFLWEMYGFRGTGAEPRPYADEELCRQLMKVPGPRKVLIRYKVAPGDSLWSIASRFGCGPDSLTTLNKISDPKSLQVGQLLYIVCDREKALQKHY